MSGNSGTENSGAKPPKTSRRQLTSFDVRRACDVLTPSGARVNAFSIYPVAAPYITLRARYHKNVALFIFWHPYCQSPAEHPTPTGWQTKRELDMSCRALDQDRDANTNASCVFCGVQLGPRPSWRRADLICLLCRAAILDRVYRSRYQRTSKAS